MNRDRTITTFKAFLFMDRISGMLEMLSRVFVPFIDSISL